MNAPPYEPHLAEARAAVKPLAPRRSRLAVLLRTLLLFAMTSATASCGSSDTCGRILAWVAEHCTEKSDYSFELEDLARFEWQRMYFLNEGVRRDTISALIGTPYPDWDTVTQRLVFLDRGRIVRIGDHLPDLDSRKMQSSCSKAPSALEGSLFSTGGTAVWMYAWRTSEGLSCTTCRRIPRRSHGLD